MTGFSRTWTAKLTLLTGAIVLFGVDTAVAPASDWLRIGPPRTPEQYWRDEQDYRNRVMQPDAGPPPPSSWFWPSLHEALDQYGWFGNRVNHASRIETPLPFGPPLTLPAPGAGVPPAPEMLPAPRTMPANAVQLRVVVPADAVVWVDDRPTTHTGTERILVSPPLGGTGPYTYEVRARWPHEGQMLQQTRRVQVYPGDRLTVDFAVPEANVKRE